MAPKGIPRNIQSMLDELHLTSIEQESKIQQSHLQGIRRQYQESPEASKKAMDDLMLDKFIALDDDKCHFMHDLILATGATTVVEAGTSFGVSTIYLALAVGRNMERLGHDGRQGVVIATEKEASKAAVARKYWKQAGPEVEKWISLREGDLNETLSGDLGLAKDQSVDFMLLDIWPYAAVPALKLTMPKLRRGAVILTDNTISSKDSYAQLFGILRDPNGPFQNITLPFKGGFEMSVYNP